MEQKPSEVRWVPNENDLANMSPEKARDLILECFFQAQKETFARARKRLGQVPNEKELRDSIEGAVRLAFKEVNGTYGTPTFETLTGAVGVLARKAEAWGTPRDIVDFHSQQISKVLKVLEVNQGGSHS
ncbi:MAG: hypothetical protein P8018_14160 [Acidobacteriota bacterium]